MESSTPVEKKKIRAIIIIISIKFILAQGGEWPESIMCHHTAFWLIAFGLPIANSVNASSYAIVLTAHYSFYPKLNTITPFLLNVSLWYFILMKPTLKQPPCNKNEQASVLVTSFTSRTEFYTFVTVKTISHYCGFFFPWN